MKTARMIEILSRYPGDTDIYVSVTGLDLRENDEAGIKVNLDLDHGDSDADSYEFELADDHSYDGDVVEFLVINPKPSVPSMEWDSVLAR